MSVVVTGIGTLGCWGHGTKPLAESLRDSTTHAVEMEQHRAGGSHISALVTDTDFSAWIPPLKARRMSPPSRMAVVAALMALKDAGIEQVPDRTGVALATAFGPTTYTVDLLTQIAEEGPAEASPFLFTDCVANAPAAQVAIRIGAHGPNATITQREAGPCLALARAAALVESGRAPCMLAGSFDEITPLTHQVLDRFRAVANPKARPFDSRRNGSVPGEGATVLVLEREDEARARGGRVLARIADVARACDPTAPAHDWGSGDESLARALAPLVAGVDRVVTTASGSVRGDALEARILNRVFDREVPPLLAPKAVTGEYGGGLLAGAMLAMSGAPFGPTPGFASSDLGVVPHDGRSLDKPRRLLVSSLAPAGAAAWVVLEAAL